MSYRQFFEGWKFFRCGGWSITSFPVKARKKSPVPRGMAEQGVKIRRSVRAA